MSTKYQILSGLGLLLLGIGIGRFSLPAKVITKTETIEVEKKQAVTNVTQNDKSTTTVTETKKPDGTVSTTTVVSNNITTNTHDTAQDVTDSDTKTDKEITYNTDKLGINVLAGVDVTKPTQVIYGGQLEYRVIGPVNAGIFGLANGLFGVSLGLRF